MVSVKAGSSKAPVTPQVTNYHVLASRFLQKQFVHSCVCIFVCCYISSFFIGYTHGFKQLLPWTWTGIRSLTLFLAVFPISLVRKVNLHVVPLHKSNHILTALYRLWRLSTMRTFMAYMICAHVITALYVRNCSQSKAFSLLISLSSYELPRINERYLYLQLFSVYCAMGATMYHALYDLDFMELPYYNTKISIQKRLQNSVMQVVSNAFLYAFLLSSSAPVFYGIIRNPLYRIVYQCLQLVFALPKTNRAANWPVEFSMFISTLLLSFIGNLLWLWTNDVFSIYLSQSPQKKGRLISDKSISPNETLLTGLSDSSRCLTQGLALVEMFIISEQDKFKPRRTSLFEAGDSEAFQWQTLVTSCLSIVHLSDRCLRKESKIPPESVKQHQEITHTTASPTNIEHNGIRVVQANIFRPDVSASRPLEKTLQKLKSELHSTEDNQKQIAHVYSATERITVRVQSWVQTQFVAIYDLMPEVLKGVFRTNLQASLKYSRLQIYAVQILRNLLEYSIEEDTFGRVHKDVSRILAEFLEFYNLLRNAEMRSKNAHQSAEFRALEKALNESLLDIGALFGQHLELPPEVLGHIHKTRSEQKHMKD